MSSWKKIIVPLMVILLLCYLWSLFAEITEEVTHQYTYYTEADRMEGKWNIHWQPNIISPLLQVPELGEMTMVPFTGYVFPWYGGEDASDELRQEESVTVHVYIMHREYSSRAKAGFFTWGKDQIRSGDLLIIADTGSQLYLARDVAGIGVYSYPMSQQAPLEERAATRRKTLIPTGFHPSILWVLLAYLVVVGYIQVEDWRGQRMEVTESSSEHISPGPEFSGNWQAINDRVIKLPKYKFTSPPMAQLMPGQEFRHGVKVNSYVVVRTERQEARTGPLVWAKAKDTCVELVVVAESGMHRFTSQDNPQVFHQVDRDFGDKSALVQRGGKRKRWLVPVALRWK